MQALSSISPRFYTNEELHVIYPSILKGPAHLPLDYLINNEMTQFLYGTCIVAILQDFYNTENVDDYLSITVIAFLMHKGGISASTVARREFVSEVFFIFSGDKIAAQLKSVVESKLE
jgi:hypothetical protein